MEVSEELLKALSDFNRTDSPINLTDLNAKKEPNGKYRIMIQSKTPEFKEFKKDFKQLAYKIPGDIEDEYEAVAKAIEKADAEGSVDLIKQGRKSGLEEEEKEYVTQDGTSKTATSQQKNDIAKTKAGSTLKYRKAGSGTTSTTQGALEENEQEMQEPNMEQQQPTGTEIAGQVAEIVEKLKAMSEGSEDPKKQKLAAKAMKQMESAKAALEALTAHETMLEEKDQAAQEKNAEKHRKNIEKIFKGIVKDENIVNRLKEKLSAKDIAALSKRLGEKGKELDEEKLARIVLNRSLKEGWVKKK
jgi:hypothetical protein